VQVQCSGDRFGLLEPQTPPTQESSSMMASRHSGWISKKNVANAMPLIPVDGEHELCQEIVWVDN